tara:strand:+ start:412 stop:624 length:213 start_codon:yes stop_codon:yes gene_type:complete
MIKAFTVKRFINKETVITYTPQFENNSNFVMQLDVLGDTIDLLQKKYDEIYLERINDERLSQHRKSKDRC